MKDIKKKLLTIVVVLAVLAGCNMNSVPEAKKEAYQRWYQTRAELLYGLARERFEAGDLKKARGKVIEALGLNPKHTASCLLLAKIYIEQGKYPLAVAQLERARADAPNSAELFYLLGVAQEKSKLLDDALVSYRRSHAIDPTNMAAVTAASEVLVAQGKIRQAQLYVESYISAAGDDPGVYELAGRLAMMRSEYGKAAEYYQHASDLDQDNVRYAESLAKAQFFSKDFVHALEGLNRLARREDYKPAAWVFTMLGDCHMALGQTGLAREAYYRATELSPAEAGLWENLAKAALSLHDLPRSIIAARQALTLEAGRLDAMLLLGYAMLKDGQIAQSVSHLKRAVAVHPESAELRCVLGRAYAAAGDEDLARRCYAEALRIDPDNALAKRLLEEGNGASVGLLSKAE